MTSAWGYIARATIRRRWLGLVVAGVAIGVATGAVIAVAAAASRTASAYDRLAAETLRYDLAVQDDRDGEPVIEAMADLPGVDAYDRLAVYFGLVGDEELLVTGGVGGDFGTQIDRPVMVDGRRPDPAADDEIMVNELAAESFDLSVGDTMDIATLTTEQFDAVAFGGQQLEGVPEGPTLHLRVVGIGKIPDDLDAPDAASMVPSRVIALLVGRAGGFDNLARVRLSDPARPEAFIASLEDVPGYQPELVYVTRGTQDGRRVSDATRVESVSTGLLALASGLALTFVIALVIARSGAAGDLGQRSLAACGLDRRARALAYGLPSAATGVVAALTAVPVAIGLSSFFPIGVAGHAEPEPGVDVDVTTLLVGVSVLLVVVLVSVAAMAWRASAAAVAPTGGESAGGPAAGDALVRNLGLGPAAGIGVRLALSPGRGPSTVPARSAIASLVLGVAGVTAVLVFAASLDRLVTTPEYYGVAWDLAVSASDDPAENQELRERLLHEASIDGLVEAQVRQVEIGGSDIPISAPTTLRGDLAPVYLSGRAPTGPEEIALGPLEQRDLDISVGDSVTLPGTDGPVTAELVGTVLVPVEDDEAGRGGAMTANGLDQLASSGGFASFLVDVAPGTEVEDFADDLGAESEQPRVPTSVDNLSRAKGVPRLLAGFLAMLGVAGVVHALAVTAQRRRRDLWTLRAIGLRRGQLRSVFGWQALAIGVVGVSVGMALGIAGGRTVWRFVANGLGVVTQPADLTLPLLAGAVATVALVVLTGALIGRFSVRWIVARPPRQE